MAHYRKSSLKKDIQLLLLCTMSSSNCSQYYEELRYCKIKVSNVIIYKK